MVKCPRCGYENDSSSTYCVNWSYILDASPTGTERKKWNLSTGKKVVLIVGIILIGFILFSFIHDVSKMYNNETLNVVEADSNVQSGSNYPYQINITYNGTWYGRVGDPNYLQEEQGSGNSRVSVNCVSWDRVSANISKGDQSSNLLRVQILRNGVVVAENSTSAPGGHVTVVYN